MRKRKTEGRIERQEKKEREGRRGTERREREGGTETRKNNSRRVVVPLVVCYTTESIFTYLLLAALF